MEVSATDCVAQHIAEKARQGCALHRAVHQMIATNHTAGYNCVACSAVFGSRNEAFLHLERANDAAHAAFKLSPGQRPANQERPAVEGQGPPEVRAGLGREAMVTAESAASADPAAADRAQAVEEQERRRAETAAASLYAAAKMGDRRAVLKHLDNGAEVNALHDDGFTPLMTAAEAGHAEVVRALADHHACDPLVRNVYGQTALHFAAQNGQDAAVDALLEASQSVAILGQMLDAKAGGSTPAEKARRAGHMSLASKLASKAEQHQLARLLHELTEPATGLKWQLVAVPRNANPNDELDRSNYPTLYDALSSGQLTFTHAELEMHDVDRLSLKPSNFLRKSREQRVLDASRWRRRCVGSLRLDARKARRALQGGRRAAAWPARPNGGGIRTFDVRRRRLSPRH